MRDLQPPSRTELWVPKVRSGKSFDNNHRDRLLRKKYKIHSTERHVELLQRNDFLAVAQATVARSIWYI